MIKDLIKLIFATIIFNPMALLGIAGGVYLMRYYGVDNMLEAINNRYLIGIPVAAAFLYAILFKHIYKVDTTKINWIATIMSTVNHLLAIVFAAACTCVIIYSIEYGFGDKLDDYLRYHKHAHEATEELPNRIN